MICLPSEPISPFFSLFPLITGSTKAATYMFFVNSATNNATIIFSGPRSKSAMKDGMFNIQHYFKVAYNIIKSIPIFMMDMFMFLKFVVKMLFHQPAVLIYPSPFGTNLNLPIFEIFNLMKSSAEKRFSTGVIHARHSFRHVLFHYGFISGLFKTSGALTGVVEGFPIQASHGNHGVATDTTWFLNERFHGIDYIPTICKGQVNYGGTI